MKLGIVGSEAAKFTAENEMKAREIIRALISHNVELVVSGGCHLGGVDIYAVDEARRLSIPYKEYLPDYQAWTFYRARNLKIARASDKVVCITIKTLPEGYKAKGFEHYCYHCQTGEHIKSGGCWTVKQAIRMGKLGEVIVIP